mgnify:CR=1 FL=1
MHVAQNREIGRQSPRRHAASRPGRRSILTRPQFLWMLDLGWSGELVDGVRQYARADYQPGGTQLDGITPNDYTLQFAPVPGFEPPGDWAVTAAPTL